jgi:hypothetical protein
MTQRRSSRDGDGRLARGDGRDGVETEKTEKIE